MAKERGQMMERKKTSKRGFELKPKHTQELKRQLKKVKM
jgi:hypothetical protein